jgi:uncharacterized protein (TIGR00303 family)
MQVKKLPHVSLESSQKSAYRSKQVILKDLSPRQAIVMTGTQEFVTPVNDPGHNFEKQCGRIRRSTSPHYLLCIASTEVSDREGISAAGSTAESRRLTPALDAEALLMGRTVSAQTLPVSPKGIVSPVVITRAALQLCDIDATVMDCGAFVSPAVTHLQHQGGPARCPSSGNALTPRHVKELFERGKAIGANLARQHDTLIIAECVPGGTTTALGIMLALGMDVKGLVSSSLQFGDHGSREAIIEQGLSNSRWTIKEYANDPLLCVAAVGDPMQAFVAGAALEASKTAIVMLAGGSQMLAVNALLNALTFGVNRNFNPNHFSTNPPFESILVATTKWVAFDANAHSTLLSRLTNSCLAASCPDFKLSRHTGLQAYEEGHVKEGVGAGAAMAVANMRGFSPNEIMQAIDNCYDEMVLGKISNLS